MPLDKNSYNLKLYNLLKTRGYRPIPLDSKGERSEAPQEADVFKFTFSKADEKVGTMYATVEEGDIVLYYDEDEVSKSSDANTSGTEFTDSFTGLIRHLKHWAMTRQLGFRTEPDDKLGSDMAQREYMKKKENISEGYYPMGKSASYNDAVPTVKIILQHTRQIQEGEQRFRHVSKIFLENTLGERILAPTIRPGIAQVYARHIAEGGVPNDERWNHIKSLCEDYSKMAGFVRAVKNNQFNESAQQLVNEGVNHYQSLRETLGRMRGHRGYNAYFESWTPTLMEEENSDNTLNELFVQETLDPRIESVLPILSKLRKTVGEMKEVNELAEWAEELTEAPGAETLAHNEKTEKSRLDAFDLEESDDAVKAGQVARDKIKKPAFMRKAAGERPATLGDVERSQQHRSSQAMVGQKGEEVEESGLQAYLGNKKYGKDGMDALRKAGRDGASKEKMAKIRAKYDKLDEEGVAEAAKWRDPKYKDKLYTQEPGDSDDYDNIGYGYDFPERPENDPGQKRRMGGVGSEFDRNDPLVKGQGIGRSGIKHSLNLAGKRKGLPSRDQITSLKGSIKDAHGKHRKPNLPEQGVAEGWNDHLDDPDDYEGHLERLRDLADLKRMQDREKESTDKEDNSKKKVDEVNPHYYDSDLDYYDAVRRSKLPKMPRPGDEDFEKYDTFDKPYDDYDDDDKDLKEGVTKRSLSEMDSQGYKGYRDNEDKGKGPEKVVKPAKAKDVAKDAEKELTKVMDKAHKKDVAEGSGSKYKVKSIGKDSKGDYYISPVTGKKVYKSGVNKGDHENPKTGEIKKGVAEGSLREFAPDDGGDGGDDGFSEETLKRFAAQWYNGDEDPRIERALAAAGWEIGQDEGYDDEPGVFVVQVGDVNGNSYLSWPAHELKQGVSEDLDANQKRVGQLGPTEKVKNNNIGKLVGASESIQHDPLKDILRLSGK